MGSGAFFRLAEKTYIPRASSTNQPMLYLISRLRGEIYCIRQSICQKLLLTAHFTLKSHSMEDGYLVLDVILILV
jgi:hypothetical protein